MKRLLLLFTVALLTGLTATAQVTTAEISGDVFYEGSTPLPGANVTAVHTPTGTTYGAVTNFDGGFNLLNLRVGGPYKISVSYVGFKTSVIEGINLNLGQTFNVEVEMVSDATQLDAVVINATRNQIINSDRTGAETNIGRRELKSLPTISRSASDFYRLEPTASSNGSFGGRNDQFNNFSLDGSIFNNPFGLDAATPGGQTNAQPISLDAIDQIQVSTAPYDVTQAGFTGASVNAVTKSGSNEIEGTVYGFYRNEEMTGDKVGGDDIIVPDLKQAQYGFSIGAPIVKDKLFIFANFEKDDREDLGSNFVAGRPGLTGANVSRVSAEDLDYVRTELANLGYETGPYEGFTHETASTKGILKLDWNINQDHRLAFIYNFMDASRDLPAHPEAGGRRGPDFTTLQFRNSGYTINNKIDSWLVELNSNFGNNISNKFQAGYTFFDDSRDPFSTPAPAMSIQEDGTRYIIVGHEPFSINNRLEQNVYQITNNLNLVSGNHTFTFGGSFEKFEFDNSFNLGAYTYFNENGGVGFFAPDFASVRTNPANPGGSFQEAIENGLIAESLTNAQNVFDMNNENGSWALAETNVGQLAFYAQDRWKITDDFTFTYGLRVDKPLYFDTQEKIQENIDRLAGGTFPDGDYQPGITYFDENGDPTNLSSLDLPSKDLLWSPRLGFNWDVFGNNKLQVRGGTGIFTGRLPFVWIGNQVANPAFYFYQTTAPDFQFPQVWRNSLGADYRFENGLVATTDFIYTKDLNAQMVRNYGLANPTGNLNGVDNRPVYLDSDRAVNEFGGITNAYVFTNTDVGYSFNWSTKLAKSFENNFYASIAYNYLKAEDASSIEAEISSDAYDRNPVLGNTNEAVSTPSRYGDKHRIVGQLNKEFNYGKDNRWRTSIGAFYEYAQGGRFSYTYSGDINNDGSGLNDLIYIPTQEELQQYTFTGTPEEQETQRQSLEQFIQQDDYLNENRGDYAEKYGILSPWRGRWDVKILQDYNFKVGEKTNTIQLSLDILNFGNLLNSDWGVIELPVNDQPIGVNVGEDNTPVYTFGDQTRTFTNDFSLDSRWQAQVGLRYIF
ncbi:carboxypeptidase regulatory-like domain-containing protein [Gramella lutea]|uniref:Carboxypeptidase regulatory-like domain-containing protein n=1 Tax=Christiangramia lutea TaxID=1607951 RepID=A0A9X1V2A9_9FLAO|nr:carboxypeptidase regulatory-like domain-containing protein [Christiangramia lutea]MCH4821669.1 carboxypeptidase regulatory-like domain-containing protein [Christiangramia lutea]